MSFEIVDRRFRAFVLHNAPLERLCTGFRWTEGPAWFGDHGALIFSDIPNDRLMCWTERAGVAVLRSPSHFANGNTRDRQGRLITCSHGLRAVVRTEFDGAVTVLASHFEGKRLNSPNDVVVKSDGTIWFTDPHYGIHLDYEGERAEQELPCNVYRFDPATGELGVVCDEFKGPNGLAFSPDERRLYIAETGAMTGDEVTYEIRAYDVAEGGLTNGASFYAVSPGVADGFRCDEHGNVWTSAGDGVHCISAAAELLGKILVPERVANLTFGGRHRARIFICASTSVYSTFLNVRGLALV